MSRLFHSTSVSIHQKDLLSVLNVLSRLFRRCLIRNLNGTRQAGDGVKKKAKKARTSKSSGGSKKRGVKEEVPIVGEMV